MSYLSKLLTRNTFYHGLPSACKHFYTNFAHAPRKILFWPSHVSVMPYTTIRIRAMKQDEFMEPGIGEHDAYNKCIGRPLSPHIRIYKKQLTSLLSFCHRLTGLMMLFYVYTVTVGTWLWTDITSFFDYLASLDSVVGEYWWHALHRTVKFLVAYPFIYHSMNAIRHLSWDFGKLLGLRQIYSSGYIMQTLVIILAMIFVFLVPLDLAESEEEAETASEGVTKASEVQKAGDTKKTGGAQKTGETHKAGEDNKGSDAHKTGESHKEEQAHKGEDTHKQGETQKAGTAHPEEAKKDCHEKKQK